MRSSKDRQLQAITDPSTTIRSQLPPRPSFSLEPHSLQQPDRQRLHGGCGEHAHNRAGRRHNLISYDRAYESVSAFDVSLGS